MPLIETGDKRGSENGDVGPSQRPFWMAEGGQSLAPGAKQKNAEQTVSEDVASLANVEMPMVEAGRVEAEKVVQQWIQNAAGVVRRKDCAGLDGNDNQPQDRGDPGFQDLMTI